MRTSTAHQLNTDRKRTPYFDVRTDKMHLYSSTLPFAVKETAGLRTRMHGGGEGVVVAVATTDHSEKSCMLNSGTPIPKGEEKIGKVGSLAK